MEPTSRSFSLRRGCSVSSTLRRGNKVTPSPPGRGPAAARSSGRLVLNRYGSVVAPHHAVRLADVLGQAGDTWYWLLSLHEYYSGSEPRGIGFEQSISQQDVAAPKHHSGR